MEWIDQIVWTNVAKSVGFFAIGMLVSSIGWYLFGFWRGYTAGQEVTEEATEQFAAWMDEVNERLEKISDELAQLTAIVRALQFPPYRQP